MPRGEDQNTEWKESWRDDYLRWVCGFANAYGGSLHIGRNDRGEVTGLSPEQCRKLSEDIPNKVREMMGVVVDVNIRRENGLHYLEIVVPPVGYPVSYRGEYHYRSGSTKQQLTGPYLTHFLLQKTGMRWDDIPVERVSPDDLDEESFRSFRRLALRCKRIAEEDAALPRTELLRHLNLLDQSGMLKRAAILLFHRQPDRWFNGAWVKVGFFANNVDILYQDEVHGSLMMQAERVLDLIYTKYLRAAISYEDVHRVERYPFPREAVREALYNALIHSDYSSNIPMQISVYENKLYIFNKAMLPPDWTVETLLGKHSSNPLNPSVAGTFFRAGYVESWGRGIETICKLCALDGCPPPTYSLASGGVMICFHAAELPVPVEQPKPKPAPELSERQSAILAYLREHPKATYEEMAAWMQVGRRTLSREISVLLEAGVLCRDGGRKLGAWQVRL